MEPSTRLLLLLITGLAVQPLRAQEHPEVPRSRTFPGIEQAAFPYVQPEAVGLSSKKLERLGEEIMGWIANGDLVGAELLVVKNDRIAFHEAYGWSDREERRPMERNSIHHLASMTKPFTAMSVLMLAEEGKLSLDDPVSRYITTYAGEERVTIRHLLSQTSGDDGRHGKGGYNVYDFDTLEAWVTDWAGHEPTGTFGEFRYSNFNFAALGYIVERVSGMPLEVFTRDRILAPLALEDTHTAFAPETPWATRTNSRYTWNREALRYERSWSNRDPQPWSFFPAAFGLWGTAIDYAKFVTAWLDKGRAATKRLLSEETVEAALSPQGFLGDEAVYGYGWFVEEARGDEGLPLTFRHGGGDGTVAVAYPSDRAMVVYLTQSERPPEHPTALQNRIGMLGLFEHPGPWMEWADEVDVNEVELSMEERVRYVGTYLSMASEAENTPELALDVFEEDRHLHLRYGESGMLADQHFHLVPLGNSLFAYGRYGDERLAGIDPSAKILFHVEDGEVKGLDSLVEGEVEFSAKRVQRKDMAEEENR